MQQSLPRLSPALRTVALLLVVSAGAGGKAGHAALPPFRCALTLDTPAAPSESAAALYDTATRLLKRGQRFDDCIQKLETAVHREPDNAAFHTALGCACASRLASLADAASFLDRYARDKARYQDLRAAWESAQKDASSLAYGTPPPTPPVLRTKDDGKVFVMDRTEYERRCASLYAQALTELDAADHLTESNEEKSDAAYTRGWALYLIWRFVENGAARSALREHAPQQAEIIACFHEATRRIPDRAAYWQSLGDAYLPRLSGPSGEVPANFAPGVAAYRTALAQERHEPTIWYRLYELYWRKKDLSECHSALHKVLKNDAGNAAVWYQLAATDSKRNAPPDTVLDSVEQGNRATAYRLPGEKIPVPPLLAVAWSYRGRFDEGTVWFESSTDLVIAVTETARARLKAGAIPEATRAANALIGMGVQMLARADGNPSADSAINFLMYYNGRMILNDGYGALIAAYRANGDTNREKAAAEALAAALEAADKGQKNRSDLYRDGYGDY